MSAKKQSNPRAQSVDVVARMLAAVPYLIDNSPVTVEDAAATFGISKDDMRSIVRTLFVTGIPGESGTGMPQDLFDFDYDLFVDDDIIDMTNHVGPANTPRFSGREAAALIAGLQYMSDIVRDDDRPAIEALTTKIKRGSTNAPENIVVRMAPLSSDATPLRDAINDNKQVTFSYVNAQGLSEKRQVCPLRLDLVGNTWYLRGYCHLRDSLRTFRTDRMRHVEILEADRDHNIAPESLPDTLFDVPATDEGIAVVLEVPASAVALLADYNARVSPSSGGVVRADITMAHVEGLRRLVSLLPGGILVVEPDFAVRDIALWAQRSLKDCSPS